MTDSNKKELQQLIKDVETLGAVIGISYGYIGYDLTEEASRELVRIIKKELQEG